MTAPKSINEYLRRMVLFPWLVAGGISVLMLGAAIYFVAIKSPPKDEGRRTKSDLRYVYAGVCGAFILGSVAWAPFRTRTNRILFSRGKFAAVTKVYVKPVGAGGSRPVNVSYEVEGQEYSITEALPDSTADELVDRMQDAMVIYDPQKPSRAMTIPPSIGRLPLD